MHTSSPECCCRQNNRSCTEDSPTYRLNQSLLLQMLASFARSYVCLSDSYDICGSAELAFKMTQEYPSVSALDFTDKL